MKQGNSWFIEYTKERFSPIILYYTRAVCLRLGLESLEKGELYK